MRAETSFRERLRQGDVLIGTVVTLGSPDVAEMLALVGFDYLWLDTEHAPGDMAAVQGMIQAVGDRCATLVRVPENREVWIKRALDTGCDGVIVPQVRSPAEAQSAVHAALYPPLGMRSVGITRAHRYGLAFEEIVATANGQMVVVVQIEHTEAVERIEEILAVPGISAVMVGPYDLSGSMGLTGQVTHPKVQGAIARVVGACRRASVPAGIFAVNAEAAQAAVSQGFTLLGLGLDSMFLWQRARDELTRVRSGPDSGRTVRPQGEPNADGGQTR